MTSPGLTYEEGHATPPLSLPTGLGWSGHLFPPHLSLS